VIPGLVGNMSSRWIVALALASAVPAFAGCIEEGTIETITVGMPGYGESWTTATDGHVSTYAWADAPSRMPDRFGVSTPVVLLRMASQEVAGSEHIHEWSAAVELGQGNWITRHHWTSGTHASCAAGGPVGLQHQSMEFGFYEAAPAYEDHPVPFGFGTLWGRTLHVGDVIRENETRPAHLGRLMELEIVYRVVQAQDVLSPLPPNGERVPVLVVERVVRLSYAGAHDPEPGTKQILYVGDGLPVPLFVQNDPKGTGANAGEIVSTLVAYSPAAQPIVFEPAAAAEHFQGPPAGMELGEFRHGAPMERLALEFPFDDALRALLLDPKSAPLALWLQQHPEAYALSADYDRDPANQTYAWQIALTDGSETRGAQVERRVYGDALRVDSVRGLASERFSSARPPPPASVHAFHPVDAGEALRVAEGSTDLTAWRHFGWVLSQGDDGPRLSYTFAPRIREERASAVPYYGSTLDAYAPTRSVDGLDGGLASAGFVAASCRNGFDLPVVGWVP
jgi:hypothetical protein